MLRRMFLAAFLAFALIGRNANASGERDLLIIFDASQSMAQKTSGGVTRIDAAKKAFVQMMNHISDSKGVNVGLMVYGHRLPAGNPRCCGDIELVVPVDEANRKLLSNAVMKLRPLGKTPITASLTRSASVLQKLKTDRQKVVVLLTDGIETCGGDPRKAAAALQKLGIKVDFYVIGFDLPANQVKQVKEIAEAGKGKFLKADNAKALEAALKTVEKEIKAAPEKKLKTHFFDDFKGDKLAEHWEVLKRDEESYIVENGYLLINSGTEGSVTKDNIVNFMRLTNTLPTGDWTMTARIQASIQTGKERILFGLHNDKQQSLCVNVAPINRSLRGFCDVCAVKVSKSKVTELKRQAWSGTYHENKRSVASRFEQFPTILLRLEKNGRTYKVSYGFEVKVKQKTEVKWSDVGKLTSLRGKGKLAIGLSQTAKVAGESNIKVDWVKIETPEK